MIFEKKNIYDLWKEILNKKRENFSWRTYLKNASKSEKCVLFCTIGSHKISVMHDSVLSAALAVRGIKVCVLMCDGVLPACEVCVYQNIKPEVMLGKGPKASNCKKCWESGSSIFNDLGIKIYKYSDFLEKEDFKKAEQITDELDNNELKSLVLDGINIGEEAFAGTLRYFFSGSISEEPYGFEVLRKYLQGGVLSYKVANRAFKSINPVSVAFHHGIYIPLGIHNLVARNMNIRSVAWRLGYRNQTVMYSHKDTYMRSFLEESEGSWGKRRLSGYERKSILKYIETRKNNSQDWFKFNPESPLTDPKKINKEFNLNSSSSILLLTNIVWDAQIHYKNNAFPTILDWLCFTVNYFKDRKDLRLIIRIHPSEKSQGMLTRHPIMEEVMKKIFFIPENVRIVEAASKISTYTLAKQSNCVLVYGTTTAIELAAMGIPVVVAGEAVTKNKNITYDISTRKQYLELLEKLPFKKRFIPKVRTERAVRYAYHYYFQKHIPFKYLVKTDMRSRSIGPDSIALDSFSDLESGRDRAMDIICGGILNGTPYVYDK
jgi:hypothetical protein